MDQNLTAFTTYIKSWDIIQSRPTGGNTSITHQNVKVQNDFAMIFKHHCDKLRPNTQNTAVFIDDSRDLSKKYIYIFNGRVSNLIEY